MWNLQTWRAVLVDLWSFAIGRRAVTLLELPPKSFQSVTPVAITLPPPTAPVAVPTSSVSRIVPATPDERYIVVSQAAVSVSPYQGFDTILTYIKFGEAVTIRAYHGDYAQIMTASGPGWVYKDVLEPSRSKVWPTLIAGNVYDADCVVTQLIRRHLNDMFATELLCLPLQSVEYVSYRLKQVKRSLNWGAARPRLPGLWQQQLKGRPGVHIGIQPLADSIMEYRDAAGEGVLLYVEAVAPDNTLTCSTVGLEEMGQYTSAMYEERQWREWAPVFIDILA